MAGQVNGLALGAIGVGVVFAWSGLNNKKILATIQDLVKGEKPTPGPSTTSSTVAANQNTISTATGNTGADSVSAAQNQATAKLLAAPFGWSAGQQWTCLVELWNQESGWSNTAKNASGAYGIAQAHPNTKYPLPGRPPSEGGTSSPAVQIAWGLTYILETYGSPCNAWAHEEADGWY
jgi:resuscitation-promoting factor RpfB